MKKLIVLSSLFAMAASLPLDGSYENVKKVNATPGMSTWTIARKHSRLADEITPTPLFSTDTAITAPGSYVLAEDLTQPLTISANDVCLDLGCHSIETSPYGITVNSGFSNIRIYNGVLYDCGVYVNVGCSNIDISCLSIDNPDTGIYFDSGCSNVFLKELVIADAQNFGIYIQGGCSKFSLDDIAISTSSVATHAVHVDAGSTELAMKNIRISGGAQVGLYVYSGCVGLVLQDSTIKGSPYGVQVLSGCGGINLKDTFISSAYYGVAFEGSNPAPATITACTLSGVKCINVTDGFYFDNVQSCIVKDCHVMYASQYGFYLNACDSNCFYDCSSLNMSGSSEIAGFKANSGVDNMFQRCVVKRAYTNSATFGDTANGFMLTGGEYQTKIVDSIVNDIGSAGSQTAVTYGINMQPYILGSFIADAQVANLGVSVGRVAWAPSSDYIAVCRYDSSVLNIYLFNPLANALYPITSVSGIKPVSVAWSPDGKYLLVGDGSGGGDALKVRIYQFDGNALTLKETIPSGLTFIHASSLCWSPNGKYFAIGQTDNGGSTGTLLIYSFDATTNPSTLVNSTSIATGGIGQRLWVDWSPDGTAIATMAYGRQELYVLRISTAGGYLTGDNVVLATGVTTCNGPIKWSPCGRYISMVDGSNARIYRYDGSTIALAAITGVPAYEIKWSPDGRYIVTVEGSSGVVRSYSFTGSSLVPGPTIGLSLNLQALSWAPNGRYVVTGSYDGGTNAKIAIVDVMSGPVSCFVDNCRVCDVKAAYQNMGRGYFGYAGGYSNNYFTRNVASNNGVNYSFGIPNVYDGRFELYPGRSAAQPFDNVSIPETL